ncbi:malonyl-CoA synthase [uncultured Jannaschia sp.]|uniref:malonate--CoA ligase n=1 Tax=uncultured Jannaschia sp. TaxID=293347 RepID=UPI0026018601|nr:malonyl-CoA synthase [uncultured Jannaschia sp.]
MPNHLWAALFARHEGSDTPFLHLPDGTTWTHGAYVARAARLAAVLAGKGVAPGDRVAVQVAKSPDALVLYAACVRAGIVFLPLNTAYTPSELDYFVSDADATLLVCDAETLDALRPVAEGAGADIATLDALVAEAEGAEVAPVTERRADDLAAILYTSGTTGRSKGAMLTHANLASNAEALSDAWRFTAEDTLIHALPIFHTHGLFVATNVTLMAGGALILQPRFDPEAILAAMPRATVLMGVPTFYTRLLDQPDLTRDATRGMRLFVSGSAPLLAETHRQFELRTGHRILERYGMTETNMNASNPYEGERRPGTVGPALPGVEIRVADAEGRPVSAGEVGTVEVRGPNVFCGYWRMPDKTTEEMRPDGFFITGDLGTLSDDGYLAIVGRAKDLVISGGYNIYPKEIEMLLDEIPGILESAVIGVPHPDMGEGLVGVLVPEPGATIDSDAVIRALDGRIARFKQPRQLETVEELPRNTMGKVQKDVLRGRFENAFKTD